MVRRILTMVILASTSLYSLTTSAEPSRDAEQLAGENPLEPFLKQLGSRWGVDVRADRFALNPVQGTIVLRGTKLASSSQQQFVSIDRLSVRANWKTRQVEQATVEGAQLTIDVSAPISTSKLPEKGLLGQVFSTDLRSGTLALSSGGAELVRLEAVEAKASDLALSVVDGRLSLTGRAKVARGDVILLGGALRATGLRLESVFVGRRLELRALTATLEGGTASCTGQLDLGLEKSPASDGLVCEVVRLPLKVADRVDVVASGEVRIQRGKSGFHIDGDLEVLSGNKLSVGRWGKGPLKRFSSPVTADVDLRLPGQSASHPLTVSLRTAGSSGSIQLGGGSKGGARAVESALQRLSPATD